MSHPSQLDWIHWNLVFETSKTFRFQLLMQLKFVEAVVTGKIQRTTAIEIHVNHVVEICSVNRHTDQLRRPQLV